MAEPGSPDRGGPPSRCLVIGIGNGLRRDDGVGHVVVRALAREAPDVDVLLVHQVVPELAATLSGRRTAVFVDARITLPGPAAPVGVAVRRLAPERCGAGLGHVSDPSWLLVLTEAMGGDAPDAWLVTLPAVDLGFGEGLSREAARLVPEAVAAVRGLTRLPPVRGSMVRTV